MIVDDGMYGKSSWISFSPSIVPTIVMQRFDLPSSPSMKIMRILHTVSVRFDALIPRNIGIVDEWVRLPRVKERVKVWSSILASRHR